jgi:hypothetical protein
MLKIPLVPRLAAAFDRWSTYAGFKGLLPNCCWNKHIPRGAYAERRRGGLFKDEQYRLIRSASRISVRSALRADFEQTAPALTARGHPRLTQAGNGFFSRTVVGQHAL